LAPNFAFGIGLHQDEGHFSYFLRAPSAVQFDGRLTRSEAADHRASLYSLSVNFPFKQHFLGQLELKYAAVATNDDIKDGTTDLVFRTRARVSRMFALVASLRSGTGSDIVFPYASGTVDIEAGVAVRDTVGPADGPRPFSWWVFAGGTKIVRSNDALKNPRRYDDSLKGSAGMIWRMVRGLDVQFGAFAYPIAHGPTRQVYFLDFDYRYSDALAFFATGQAEGGKRDERAVDFAGTVGLRVRY